MANNVYRIVRYNSYPIIQDLVRYLGSLNILYSVLSENVEDGSE